MFKKKLIESALRYLGKCLKTRFTKGIRKFLTVFNSVFPYVESECKFSNTLEVCFAFNLIFLPPRGNDRWGSGKSEGYVHVHVLRKETGGNIRER